MIIFIFIILIFIFVISFLIFFLVRKKYDKFILKNSIYLKKIIDINQRYKFYPFISFDQFHTYDNEHFYETISCADFLIYQLQYLGKQIRSQIDKLDVNKQLYLKYLNEIHSIKERGQFEVQTGKLKLEKLLKKEEKLIQKHIYNSPELTFSLTVTLYCSKINGEIYKKKQKVFYADEILVFLQRLNKKSGNYYKDRDIWDAICRVERGKVSNKMRFEIYARDGYKCCRCGKSGQYVSLEIDHIIPISKGGKSTYDNLQTLCHQCNVEKGDSISNNQYY